jgi:hypothetical protein
MSHQQPTSPLIKHNNTILNLSQFVGPYKIDKKLGKGQTGKA